MSDKLKWVAEYKGSVATITARDSYAAKKLAAIEMGVPTSREKHIRLKRK